MTRAMRMQTSLSAKAEVGFGVEPVPPHNFYRALGGDGPLQYRQLDAERRRRGG